MADCIVWEVRLKCALWVATSVYIQLLWNRHFSQGASVMCSSLSGPTRHWTKASNWSKSTSIMTSWSLPLRCRQRLEACHAVQHMPALLWFTQNIIASDCLCVYWIRPALLMHKEINKPAVWSVAGKLGWLSQPQRWFALCTRRVLFVM